MAPKAPNNSNPFANAPQYKAGANLALKQNPGFKNAQSIPMQRGPGAM